MRFSKLAWLKQPRYLALMAVTALLAIYGGTQAWAWYHLGAAETALATYQNAPAQSHVLQALRIWPNSAAAHLLAARAERRAGDFAAAERHLDQCRHDADPDFAEAVAFEWALLRATSGDLAAVEEPLQSRLLKRPSDAPLIWEALSHGYRLNYRMPEAIVCLDTWLHFEPENAHAYFLRGEVHRQVGALNRARDEYRRVIELQPGHREALRHLARCLVQVGRYQEAIGLLDQLLPSAPGDSDLLTLKARSQYDLGQRQEAVELLAAALQKDAQYGPALRERGRIALAAEEYAEAERWFAKAREALPYNYEVNWGLYQALQGGGKVEPARLQLAQAQQLKNAYERIHEIQTHEMTRQPDDPALHADLGNMLRQTGQLDAAEYWLLSALQRAPELATAHAALAELYDQQGNRTQAEQHREEAQRLAKSS